MRRNLNVEGAIFNENSAGVSYKKDRARHSDEHKKTPTTAIEQHKTHDRYMKTPPESSRYAPTRRCERLGAKNITWSLGGARSGSTLESNKMTDIDKEERGDYKFDGFAVRTLTKIYAWNICSACPGI